MIYQRQGLGRHITKISRARTVCRDVSDHTYVHACIIHMYIHTCIHARGSLDT
jgi:hypothetical protein